MGATASVKPAPLLSLEQKVLNEQSIRDQGIPVDQLCVLKVDSDMIGPLWIADIKENFDQNEELYDITEYRMLGHESWAPIYEHSFFQRRRPQLISDPGETSWEQQTFHVKKGHHSLGPLSFSDIEKALSKSEIQLDDYYSIDGGNTWSPLHQIDDLNRRKPAIVNSLPTPIPDEVLVASQLEAREVVESENENAQQRSAVAGLAFIGPYGKIDETVAEKNSTFSVPEATAPERPGANKFLWVAIIAGLMVMGGLVAYLLLDSGKKITTDNTESVSRQKPRQARRTNTTKKDAQPESSRSPALNDKRSFKESPVYDYNKKDQERRDKMRQRVEARERRRKELEERAPQDDPYTNDDHQDDSDPYSRRAGKTAKPDSADNDSYDNYDDYAEKEEPVEEPYPEEDPYSQPQDY